MGGHGDGGKLEHQVRDHRADTGAHDLGRDVDERLTGCDTSEHAVGQRDDRVEVRARYRPEGEDQRDERGAGRDRVLEELEADVVRGESLRGDAGADDDGNEQRGTDCLGRRAAREVDVHDRPRELAAALGRLGRVRATQRVGRRARPCGALPAPSRRRRARCRSPTGVRPGRRPTPCPARRSSRQRRPRWRSAAPRPSSRASVAATSSVDSTSTPRWLSEPGSPLPSMSTSFSGGSAIAKLA